MNIVLISTYELGRQPFGVVSPAAWLRKRGHQVACFDLTRQELDQSAARAAALIAIYLPMHTATRLAAKLIPSLREQNPAAHICCYGLYAPMNAKYLRTLGAQTILGGEFEVGLVSLVDRISAQTNGAKKPPFQTQSEHSSEESATQRDRCAGARAIGERARGDEEWDRGVRRDPQGAALLRSVALRPRARERGGEDSDAESGERCAELPRSVCESPRLAGAIDPIRPLGGAHAEVGEGWGGRVISLSGGLPANLSTSVHWKPSLSYSAALRSLEASR